MTGKGKTMRSWTALVLTFVLAAATGVAAQRVPRAAGPPDPELIDAQGFQKLLEHYRGEPLLVTFWATWCEPCRDEYPMLNDLAKQYAPEGLRVVGVNLDDDGDLILMRRFLARYKPVFPNYRKKAGGEETFHQVVFPGWSGSLPATFFYGKDGRQVGHVLGEGKRETYESAIQSLVGSGSK